MSVDAIVHITIWGICGICVAVRVIDYRKETKQWREERKAIVRKRKEKAKD